MLWVLLRNVHCLPSRRGLLPFICIELAMVQRPLYWWNGARIFAEKEYLPSVTKKHWMRSTYFGGCCRSVEHSALWKGMPFHLWPTEVRVRFCLSWEFSPENCNSEERKSPCTPFDLPPLSSTGEPLPEKCRRVRKGWGGECEEHVQHSCSYMSCLYSPV